MKAILITAKNQSKIASAFNVTEDLDERLPIGYFAATDFGVSEHFETLTAANLDEHFDRGNPVKIESDWFEITKK